MSELLVGSDDGYQAETGHPVINQSVSRSLSHSAALASNRPLCLVPNHRGSADKVDARGPPLYQVSGRQWRARQVKREQQVGAGRL